ncbi:MAG TPA: Sir2 family NAD-dependent protein deacetylase [Polyangia bacterium]|nr:Sir2 family NAD-dependent protein deacetylase [Polyangia bacterium]
MIAPADARLVELLRGARRILLFTGAGISTNSGIPDFRGPNGIWQKRQPVYFDEFLNSDAKRREYWEYKLEGYPLFVAARPNATHAAIVALEKLGRVQAVVTQNIDGLHQAAGSSEALVVELHGTNAWIECVQCEARSEPAPAFAAFERTRQVPTCARCGGWLKCATISFGQALRPDVIERGFAEAERCDLVVALGSTLSVHPAASIPLAAVRRRVPYVVVNRGATDHDEIATLRLEGDVAEIVPPAVAQLV